LMVEVCLVLAPDVNFFLNSRKQGLPCWCSIENFEGTNYFSIQNLVTERHSIAHHHNFEQRWFWREKNHVSWWSFSQILLEHGWLNRVWSCRLM